jgi:hypothetical protein
MQALYGVAILVSAPFILFPAMRVLPYAKLVVGLTLFAVFIAIVVRGLRNGELNRTLPETYAAAKAGRTAAGLALQSAAIVAVSLASWLTR